MKLPQSSIIWRFLKRESLQGAAILCALLVIFFATPLFGIGDHVYASADLSQAFRLMSVSQNYQVHNSLLSDPFSANVPWLLYNRDSLRAGKFPLWNPFNANGVPHFANYQSAVLSPFSVPWYVLPVAWAALLGSFAKLFALGLFMFLFLKQIGLRQIAALFGGSAFMFSGFAVLWLSYTITGALTVLPAGLYFIERLFGGLESAPIEQFQLRQRRNIVSLAGFCLSLCVGLLAGHPETVYFAVLFMAAYVVFRLGIVWWRTRVRSQSVVRKLLTLSSGLLVMGLLALGLTAVQLLPFAEYLANNPNGQHAGISEAYMPSRWWPLSLFPSLLGNPADPRSLNVIGQYYNYNEFNAIYIGGICLFLACLGFVSLRSNPRRAHLIFFGMSALVWSVYVFNPFGLKSLFNVIPGIRSAFYGRSMAIGLFCAAGCAALALDHILSSAAGDALRRRRLILTFSAGLVLLAIGLWGARGLLDDTGEAVKTVRQVTAAKVSTHSGTVLEHVAGISLTSMMAVGAIALLWNNRSPKMRTSLGALIIVLAFVQTGFLLRDYNPTIAASLFYPQTADMRTLQSQALGKNLLFLGSSLLPPDVNVVYGLPTSATYDSIDVGLYDQLARVMLGAQPPFHNAASFNYGAVRLFGVDAIVIDNQVAHAGLGGADFTVLGETNTYTLLAPKYAVGRYHTVIGAQVAATDEQALQMVQTPGLDLSKVVILSQPSGGTLSDLQGIHDESNPVEVVSEESDRVVLRVRGREMPGYMVLAKTYYPGWKATVNGQSAPVYRANYAFSAIPLQAGDNLIAFYYDPDSFKVGAWITLASVLVGAGLLLIGVRGRLG